MNNNLISIIVSIVIILSAAALIIGRNNGASYQEEKRICLDAGFPEVVYANGIAFCKRLHNSTHDIKRLEEL